jgi:hypothetical protein
MDGEGGKAPEFVNTSSHCSRTPSFFSPAVLLNTTLVAEVFFVAAAYAQARGVYRTQCESTLL